MRKYYLLTTSGSSHCKALQDTTDRQVVTMVIGLSLTFGFQGVSIDDLHDDIISLKLPDSFTFLFLMLIWAIVT